MTADERIAYLVERLPVMQSLQDELGAHCSERICPADIVRNKRKWACRSCVILFEGVADLNKLIKDKVNNYEGAWRVMNPCPCSLLGDAALVHLDDMIEELETIQLEGERDE